jgi:rubrerythrin
MSTYQAPPPTLRSRLQRAVLMHQASEEPSLELYRSIAAAIDDPLAKMVLESIAADEERHHDVMGRIIRRLSAEVSEGASTTPGAVNTTLDKETKATIKDLKELARHERDGVKHMRQLAADYRSIDSGLPSARIEAMAQDSKKHDQMLRFVLGRLRTTRAS